VSTLNDILGKDTPEVGVIDIPAGSRWLTNQYWMVRTGLIEDLPQLAEKAAQMIDIGETVPLVWICINGRSAFTYSDDAPHARVREYEGGIRLNADYMATIENMARGGIWERPTDPKVKVTAVYRVDGEIVAMLQGLRR